MKTFNMNANSKYPVALYRVTVHEPITDEQIERIWPIAYGKSIAIASPNRQDGWTRFDVLVAHATQTTPSDLTKALQHRGIRGDVEILMSCAEIGFNVNPGSPRRGIRRSRPNGQRGTAVPAR